MKNKYKSILLVANFLLMCLTVNVLVASEWDGNFIINDAQDFRAYQPKIAYSQAVGKYFYVWTGTDGYDKIYYSETTETELSSSPSLLQAATPDWHCDNPDLAVNLTGNVLYTWLETDPASTLTKVGYKNSPLSAAIIPGSDNSISPAVASSGDQYMIVFVNGGIIYGILFDNTGSIAGSSFMINGTYITLTASASVAVSASMNGGYKVVWTAGDKIVMADVDYTGNVSGEAEVESGLSEAGRPAVDYNSADNTHMVVWEQKVGDSFNLGAALISGATVTSKILGFNSALENDFDPDVTFNSVKNAFLATWHSNKEEGYEIWASEYYGTESFSEPFRLSKQLRSSTSSSVAFNADLSKYRAIWSGGGMQDDIIGQKWTDEHISIVLKQGWNIFSSPVISYNKNLKNILQPLIDAGQLKKVMDESGDLIEDWGVSNGGWQNTIGDLERTEGYKINVTSPVLLEISGTQIQLPLDIPLSTGWNIISWPSPNEQDGMDVFQDLIDAGKLKKVMDESGNVIEDWGASNGGWKNSIGNLKPGEGYKVNVTGDCTLTVSEGGTKSVFIPTELMPAVHFIPAFKGNGTDHMNINLLNLAESGIIEGDEIGIFDGNVCVGSAQFINQPPITIGALIVNRNSISIPVSASDGIEGKNGYTEGNPITLKLYRNGSEYPLNIEPFNPNNTLFERGGSLFAKVDVTSGLQTLEDKLEVNCYPNPFSDDLNIEVYIPRDEKIVMEIYDSLGRKVKQLYNENNPEKFTLTWNGKNDNGQKVVSGIYYLRINEYNVKIVRK